MPHSGEGQQNPFEEYRAVPLTPETQEAFIAAVTAFMADHTVHVNSDTLVPESATAGLRAQAPNPNYVQYTLRGVNAKAAQSGIAVVGQTESGEERIVVIPYTRGQFPIFMFIPQGVLVTWADTDEGYDVRRSVAVTLAD